MNGAFKWPIFLSLIKNIEYRANSVVKVYCVETQMKLVPPSYLVEGVLHHLLYLLCPLSIISSGRLSAGLPQPRGSVCESGQSSDQ